ncbi:MAG: DNA-binding protein [Proteobacteria bacterium]|nr:DNA-binding protein [Pseudomonadota bacterium]
MRPNSHHNTEYDLDQLINEQIAAEFLGYTVRALQNWRLRGGGPKFVKVSSRSIRYRRRELIAWSEAHMVSSTSQSQLY